jgi:hypothetical protein
LKNANTAAVTFGRAKRKLLGGVPDKAANGGNDVAGTGDVDGEGIPAASVKKATPRKRNAVGTPKTPKGAVAADAVTGDTIGGTPNTDGPKPKRVRKMPAKIALLKSLAAGAMTNNAASHPSEGFAMLAQPTYGYVLSLPLQRIHI